MAELKEADATQLHQEDVDNKRKLTAPVCRLNAPFAGTNAENIPQFSRPTSCAVNMRTHCICNCESKRGPHRGAPPQDLNSR